MEQQGIDLKREVNRIVDWGIADKNTTSKFYLIFLKAFGRKL